MTNRRSFLKIAGAGALLSMLPNISLLAIDSNSELLSVLKSIKKMNLSKLAIGEAIVKIAKSFAGRPYIGGTLDTQDSESLIYRLDGFDCVTFCETSLALARIVRFNEFTPKAFESELTKIRYKNGIISGYESRCHYSSEWIMSNAKLGIIKDLSKELGGQKFTSEVSFMSKNAYLYKSLKDNPAMIAKISENEAQVNSVDRYYISKTNLPKIQSKIQNGDIITVATSKVGLDYSHLGIAYRNSDDEVCLMHASSNKKKVILDAELIEYLDKSKSALGISVLRPL